MMVEK